jgi:hypothetical protein
MRGDFESTGRHSKLGPDNSFPIRLPTAKAPLLGQMDAAQKVLKTRIAA